MPDPNLKLAPIEVTDASATEADLNAKIDAELGIAPLKVEESPADETTEKPVEEDSGADPATEPDESTTETVEDTPEEPVDEPETPVKPPEAATPSDEELFIEVVDADGVTHKISSIEDLPEDFAPKNNRQILEIIKATDKLDAEREANAVAAQESERQAFIEQTKQDQFASWDAEIAELAKTKRIEATNTDRIDEVFGFMNEVNAARQKAGNPNLITSFEDALDKFEIAETKKQAETAKANDTERAKLKSSLIGRSSAASSGDSYVYRAGSARNIDDVPIPV